MSVLSIPTFTNVGYWLHQTRFEPIDGDLEGRTILITGGTGGLGHSAASALAERGARTLVVGRSREKLSAVEREIDGEVVGYEADLSLMADIRDLAARLLEEESRIDVLINNVGVLVPERAVTEEGIEVTLATDLAGHFLLTNLLATRLADSAPARIINVTSGGMYSERIRPNDLESAQGEYRGAQAYARAKRGQVILTEMWAQRFADTGVTVHAMHPGWAKTAGVERSLPTFNRLMKPFLRSPEQGADTIVWLAADSAPARRTGVLWFDRREAPIHMTDRTKESAEERQALWDRLVEITSSDFPVEVGRRG